jgi:hypothetical protein
MPTHPHIIGLGGYRRAGKDTFSDILTLVAESRGYFVLRIPMALALRRAAAEAYGIDIGAFTDDELKEQPVTGWQISPRQMLINLGQAMRGVDPDHWVKRWRFEIDRGSKIASSVVLVPDVRQDNEAEAIIATGGSNCFVTNPATSWNGHATEELSHRYLSGEPRAHSLFPGGRIDNDTLLDKPLLKAALLVKRVPDLGSDQSGLAYMLGEARRLLDSVGAF